MLYIVLFFSRGESNIISRKVYRGYYSRTLSIFTFKHRACQMIILIINRIINE